VLEGNHVWNSIAGPNHTSDDKYFPYYAGGSKMIEPWFFGTKHHSIIFERAFAFLYETRSFTQTGSGQTCYYDAFVVNRSK